MSIDAIKELIRKGDIPQASEQLREILAKTPEDAAARMLYGTCCQLMGDSATFGRIYRDLAPQMEPRVTRGERSEIVSMWLKYAAMFAAVVTCFYGALGEDAALNISNATNAMEVVSATNADDLYDRVMEMSQRDQLRYFMDRPEVKRELHKGDVRAVVIPMHEFGGNNLLLVRAADTLKTGAAIVRALREGANGAKGDMSYDGDDFSEELMESDLVACFLPFEDFVNAIKGRHNTRDLGKRIRTLSMAMEALEETLGKEELEKRIQELNEAQAGLEQLQKHAEERKDDVECSALLEEVLILKDVSKMLASRMREGNASSASSVNKRLMAMRDKKLGDWRVGKLESKLRELECLRDGEMMLIKSSKDYKTKMTRRSVLRVFQPLGQHGDISDLILSSDQSGSHVLGIAEAEPRACTRYLGPSYQFSKPVFQKPDRPFQKPDRPTKRQPLNQFILSDDDED